MELMVFVINRDSGEIKRYEAIEETAFHVIEKEMAVWADEADIVADGLWAWGEGPSLKDESVNVTVFVGPTAMQFYAPTALKLKRIREKMEKRINGE